MLKVWIVWKSDYSKSTCVQFDWADLKVAVDFVKWFNVSHADRFASIEAE